jgi:asparagine synthase (glutamine-hydrolysing)
MTDAIAHRGRDGQGLHIDDTMCLGMRRFDTLTAGGTWPIHSADRSRTMVYDGEVYNHAVLRDELVNAGHIFSTDSDGEVILHGYKQWGAEELLSRLRGKYAFVIWDSVARELFGARDQFGIKPLYYLLGSGHCTDNGQDVSGTNCKSGGIPFMFGSEIKAFLEHPGFKKELNEEVLANYLSFQYSVTQDTFFKDVRKILPGHYFTWRAEDAGDFAGQSTFKQTRYWRPQFAPVVDTIASYADWIDDAVRETVEVHKAVAPDVELGSFLSSGVDSSYIASMAKVDKTFTVGFVSELYNETDYAKEFAQHIGVKNYPKVIAPDEYWGALNTIQYHMDEPLADPAAIGLYFASKLASEHVDVVLSGEGADELFGGYGIYREPMQKAALYRKLPASVWRILGVIARPIYALFPSLPGHDFLVRRNKSLEQWFIGNADIFSVRERKALLKVGLPAPTPQQITWPYYKESESYDDVTKMQYLDINLWSAGDILHKADRMTSANSIEVRSPLLDCEIMELAEKLPLDCKVDTIHTKKAFRQAAAKTLPELTANKDKLGFPVPIRVWLKEDAYYAQVKDAFTGEAAILFFHTDKLVRLLEEHRAGKRDNSRKIWTVYMFLVWYDEFFVKR